MYADKQREILLAISIELARIRGKDDMLRIIVDVLKPHISFDDCFIMRYDKDKKTCTTYIYHATERRLQNTAFKNFLELEYPVLDDNIGDANYPVVYSVKELLPYGGEQIAFMDNSGIKEFVVLKLVDGNELTGLCILLTEQLNAFREEDLDLLHRLSYQISVATTGIIAGENIARREEEKTILLSLSYEIAALRNRNDLFNMVNAKLKTLFQVKEFGIAQINDDNATMELLCWSSMIISKSKLTITR